MSLQSCKFRLLFGFVLAFACLLPAMGQILQRPLLNRERKTPQPIADAVTGPVLGAGTVEFELPGDTALSIFTDREFSLSEKNGRVLYPAYDHTPVRAAIRNVLGLNQTLLGQPLKVRLYFLFQGNEPLELTLHAGKTLTQTVAVRADDAPGFDKLLSDWWRQYDQSVNQALRNSEYPPTVDLYLAQMLEMRLQPKVERRERILPQLLDNQGGVNEILGSLLGAESVRLAIQKENWRTGSRVSGRADQPLPEPVQPPKVDYPPPAADVQIEPLAMRVPHECFYVRFGSFGNFSWFRKTLDEWGGDLRNLVALRGVDYGLNQKMQDQLGLQESALADLLGPTVIADVAMIGCDPFMREGAAVGVLFQAKSNLALSTDLKSQRQAAGKKYRDLRDENVEIAGKTVSFLSTPDNRFRSFYVQDGDFHLVTTSRRMVERFLETGQAHGSLGASLEFRSLRTRMPLTRDDTVFAYLSDEFFRQLTGPAYRVEMLRRLQSLTEFDEWELARLAARHEGIIDLDPANLIKLGFLPPTFNQRPDGSLLLVDAQNQVIDSLRGGKGTFIPVADLLPTVVTAAEAAEYKKFAEQYLRLWTRMDPVTVGLKRFALPAVAGGETRERLTFDILIAPVVRRGVGGLEQFLAPPDTLAAHPLPEDVFLLQFSTKAGLLGEHAQPGHYAIGVRNAPVAWKFDNFWQGPVPDVTQRQKLYFAAWPEPGLLQFLGAGNGAVDANGFRRANGGFVPPEPNLWQRDRGTLTFLSYDQELLRDLEQRFPIGQAERPAQLRLHMADVGASKLREFANALGYFQARKVSAGNLHLLHQLVQQLGVPIEDAQRMAETLIQGKLLDPLGGKYEAVVDQGGARWRSTAWTDETGRITTQVPADFVTPPLGWFRGLDAEISITQNEYQGHVELELKREPQQATPAVTAPKLPVFQWPKFDLKEGGPLPERKPVEELPPPAKRVPPPPPMPDPPVTR